VNSNLTLWDPPLGVNIQQSSEKGRVGVSFGDWPSPHNTWFMSESDLDVFIMKLLDAKLKYIEGKDGQPA
jgi:hypothetical protein